MRFASATDLAIRLAAREGRLQVEECSGRFGPYWAIKDDHGTIEVTLSEVEARQRVEACTATAK